jgi:hypothetical protein
MREAYGVYSRQTVRHCNNIVCRANCSLNFYYGKWPINIIDVSTQLNWGSLQNPVPGRVKVPRTIAYLRQHDIYIDCCR